MALDPEEYKKRRQERNKKRSSRQRKTFLRLAIAGAVIVTVLAVILVIAWPKNSDSKQDSTVPTDPETVIRIAAAGDLDVTERTMDPGNMEYDFTDTFIDVAPVLADADLTVLNFEGNLYGEPYGTDRSAPQNLMTSLKNAGVDMIQLANSYSIYHGPLGLSQTVAGIKAAGMTPLGAYSNPAEAAAGKGYTIRNLTGKTYDDMVALNADDSWECSDSRGPITDILIENVTGDASYRFMRLQAIDSTVENIRIRNIRGSFGSTGVLLSLFYTELNKYSLYRNITIEDMDIEISFPGGDPYSENGGIVIDDMVNVDGLTLRNIHCRMTNDEPPPVFHISADSSVINLVMENVSAERPGRVRLPRYLKKDDNYTNAFV